MLGTKKGELAIVQPEFKKVEVEVVGGIARAVARVEIIEAKLVMNYKLDGEPLKPGDGILLRADSGLKAWAKNLFRLSDGTLFVLCPESEVIGFKTNADRT